VLTHSYSFILKYSHDSRAIKYWCIILSSALETMKIENRPHVCSSNSTAENARVLCGKALQMRRFTNSRMEQTAPGGVRGSSSSGVTPPPRVPSSFLLFIFVIFLVDFLLDPPYPFLAIHR